MFKKKKKKKGEFMDITFESQVTTIIIPWHFSPFFDRYTRHIK